MTRILGTDPGQKGALALIDTEAMTLQTCNMPIREITLTKRVQREVDPTALANILRALAPDEVWVEKVTSSPQMGVTSAFNFGGSRFALEAVMEVLGWKVQHVLPQVWKAALRVSADKNLTKEVARKIIFPRVPRGVLSNEGKCEAALIAFYGMVTSKIEPGRSKPFTGP